MAALADMLDDLPGACHVTVADAHGADQAFVTAEVSADQADRLFEIITALAVPVDDVVLVRAQDDPPPLSDLPAA
jgi:hypothetical protein